MKEFLHDDYLLKTNTAIYLYHNHAKKMPIYDFHCHLSCQDIYENKCFSSISEAWLKEDHYKWRVLRQFGVDEDYISGEKSDEEKFSKWAEVVPYTIGNPLYTWTHLELRRYFNINETLSPKTKDVIYKKCNDILVTMGVRDMIKLNNVKVIITTDDPVDDLLYHKKLSEEENLSFSVLPAFRPDKLINIDKDSFFNYIKKLEFLVGFKLNSIASLKKAIVERIDYFASLGCISSDHALDTVVFNEVDESRVDEIFIKAMSYQTLSDEEVSAYKTNIILFLGKEYALRNWVMQYHIGALRNVSTKMFKKLGPDTGYDAIHDEVFISNLASLLDSLDKMDSLPKTILYCLNPRDNEALAALINCFQEGGISSKIQYGSAWWFNDQKDGIERQLETYSQFALLSKFVGMLTDSRSFLSFPRHEFFRRILCNHLGGLVESGLYPNDLDFLGKVVEDICYNNAVNYFNNKNKSSQI